MSAHLSRREALRAGAILLGASMTATFIGCSANGAGPPAAAQVGTSALDELAARLRGTLLRPGDAEYEARSASANGRYLGTRPIAVAQVADEGDVATCVEWSVQNGVQPVARGGGHSYAGFSTTTGLLIDISVLDSVQINDSDGTVVLGGAASNRAMLAASADGPFFLPGGTCLAVCYGGLALGGGIGFNTHWAGLASDRMTATRMVTAGGNVLDASNSQHEDVFWACRGGAGGNFGINTAFTFALAEVPRHPITHFDINWSGADAAGAMLNAFNILSATAPAAFNADAYAQATEIGSGGPEAAIQVNTHGQYIGPADELRDLLAPVIAAAGQPDSQNITEMGFWDAQRIFATDEQPSHSWGDISRYASEPIPESAVGELVDLLVACPSRSDDANGSIWSLGWVGGDVVNAFGRTETAYVHRGMSTLLRPTTVWPNDAPASVGNDLNQWTDAVIAAIAPHTPDESYQNFPNRALTNWEQQYYAENFDRLVDVKTSYDPNDVFRNEQSIPVRR
ncbi:FAD-binding oxidoreductase [Hoyosella subflava]|uniref:FAD linked oxidase domain protein n=1 Tax=Hoyosella subflava (strain DSM 45089 / JCM 17490 / NBRC 109087 / DQS3-9A1) TaxID=443218 RepID=F6EGI9_HOYSD|nr:FAD-binding oxidoreductase [Hoyosella subflava]AEF41042.1 FAD linked oxidase domain protein [Hoyosella subflava DQS3-9A1]